MEDMRGKLNTGLPWHKHPSIIDFQQQIRLEFEKRK